MSAAWYERLTYQDRSFLILEGANTHMHVGGIAIGEMGTLATAEGGIDIDRIREFINARLHLMPRYLQRLMYIPGTNDPVWVDDDRFNIQYHVRHTSVPRPGDDRQVKRLTGRIMSQRLDRRRPLWELWIVEGLQANRFALIMKTHHCMIDGVSGLDLMSALMRPHREHMFETGPARVPRRIPSTIELWRDELQRRLSLPAGYGRGLTHALRAPRRSAARLARNLSLATSALRRGLQLSSDTVLNRPIGPFRRCDWTSLDLQVAKAIKNRFGGTVNDVIVAAVAGGVRRFLHQRHVTLSRLKFRAAVPVDIRTRAERHLMGNRVSAWVMMLPLDEPDPVKRLEAITGATTVLKREQEAAGVHLLGEAVGLFDPLLRLSLAVVSMLRPYNIVVTNVVGPPQPMYFLGAPLVEGYPFVPLFENQGLAIGSYSSIGKLFFGFNADWDLLPDLHELVKAVGSAFAELRDAASRRSHEVGTRQSARARTVRRVGGRG